jgi:hypothetical protein
MTGTSTKDIINMVRQGPPNPRTMVQPKESNPMADYNNKVAEIHKDTVAEITEKELKEQTEKVDISSKDVDKELEDNSFIYDDFGNKIRNQHGSRARRKRVEARCTPMDIGELLLQNYVEQTVVLRPDKLVVKYRSLSSSDIMFIFKQIEKEKMSVTLAGYKLGRMNLTGSLVSINGQALPECRIDGKIDETLFEKKYNKICSFPEDTVADLLTNYLWFTERVKDLSVDNESLIDF